jgi:hypothetical protein
MRWICRVSVIFGVLAMLVTIASAQHKIDLTASSRSAQSSARQGYGISAGARGVEGQRPPRLPAEVRLDWISRNDFILGGHVVSEVTIRNIGESVLTLPWSPERHPSPEAQSLERQLRIALSIMTSKNVPISVSVVGLFGSTDREGTLLQLQPGETATVRAPGWLTVPSSDLSRVLSSAPEPLEMRAIVNVSLTPGDWAEPLISENAVPITVRRGGRGQ